MQKTFFFHIPKCAGMSVWNALWHLYGINNVFQVGVAAQRDEFERMTHQKRSSYGAIGGHGYLTNLSRTAGDLSSYYKLTTFRHPVDRIVSEYYFIRNLPVHHKHELVSKIPLIEFAKQGDVINMQTRLTCGEADPEKALTVVETFFDHWAMIEDLDDLIARLYRHLGLRPKQAAHANKGKGRSRQTEDPAVLAEIEAMNASDMEFYRRLLDRKKRSEHWWPVKYILR